MIQSISNIAEKADADNFSVDELIRELDTGKRRVCRLVDGQWSVDEELKYSIVSYISGATCRGMHEVYDKVPLKFDGWQDADFFHAKLRVVPGAIVRYGAYLAPNVVLMNCFVNIGAYVGERTMVDSFVTVGSCAQIGANCHIAAGVVIGGVLEPITARPVIIEDDCFIGAHASVVEGVIVRQGATLGMGVHIGASTKIIDRQSGKVFYAEVPEHAIVVPGTYSSDRLLPKSPESCLQPERPDIRLQCAVIVRYGETNQKTKINEALRNE
ncbi:MAG: 2,3,4,5-tetrahydropyridine-2,6-dicarboxylate N-succinyltransferase [Holosporales bacterium]|jgi:2,3,4,5-tetrahydropyridine-2,6-dicarboxylate N-succinyltransferase|nr:2,3,4,5-tetrahydropyridine-2,6-dicarboxylate N-succinyltransferase [Holosporales bacterium]